MPGDPAKARKNALVPRRKYQSQQGIADKCFRENSRRFRLFLPRLTLFGPEEMRAKPGIAWLSALSSGHWPKGYIRFPVLVTVSDNSGRQLSHFASCKAALCAVILLQTFAGHQDGRGAADSSKQNRGAGENL
jgi:hypothetical protein